MRGPRGRRRHVPVDGARPVPPVVAATPAAGVGPDASFAITPTSSTPAATMPAIIAWRRFDGGLTTNG